MRSSIKDEATSSSFEKLVKVGTDLDPSVIDKADYAYDVYEAYNAYNNEMQETGNEYEAAKKAGDSFGESVAGGLISSTAVDMVVDNIGVIAEATAESGPLAPIIAGGLFLGYLEWEAYKAGELDEVTPAGIEDPNELKDGIDDLVKDLEDKYEKTKDKVERKDPLAIDLDMDGVETVSTENGVYFDLDKNGYAEKTGWTFSMNSEQLTVRNGLVLSLAV